MWPSVSRDAHAALAVVVDEGLAGFELIEATLSGAGHLVLTTTKPDEVVALAGCVTAAGLHARRAAASA